MNEYSKFMVVPYIPKIENPQEKYLLKLDQEMHEILNNPNLNFTQKVIYYNQIISQYKDNIDIKRGDISNDTIPIKIPQQETQETKQSNNVYFKHEYDSLKTPYMHDNFDYGKAAKYLNRNLDNSFDLDKTSIQNNTINQKHNLSNTEQSIIYPSIVNSTNLEFDDQELYDQFNRNSTRLLNNSVNSDYSVDNLNLNKLYDNIPNNSNNIPINSNKIPNYSKNITDNSKNITDNSNKSNLSNSIPNEIYDFANAFKNSKYFDNVNPNEFDKFINNKDKLKHFKQEYEKLQIEKNLLNKKPTFVTKNRNILLSKLMSNTTSTNLNQNTNQNGNKLNKINNNIEWLSKSYF